MNRILFSLSNFGYVRLLNIGLRGITLASKFLLIFFLAKFFEPRDLGIYGLFVALIGYGIYVIGFEFYTYSMRELIGSPRENRAKIIKNQFALYFFAYLLFLPVIFLYFYYSDLPWNFFWWAVVVLVLEHIAQELNRILVSLSEQLYAGVVLFVRTGLWGFVVITAQWLDFELRNLDFIFLMWSISCLMACFLAVKRIASLCGSFSGLKVDIGWIALGLKIAFPMLLASLALRGIFTFDKYFVESVGGLEILGSYVLFIGMATAVISFIDAGVIDFSYPKIVMASRLMDKDGFAREMTLLLRNVVFLGAFLIVFCAVLGYFIVGYIGKSLYVNNISILYWLLVAIGINALSLIPHVGLYALGKDRAIVFSQVFGFLVFLIFVLFFKSFFGIISVLSALCLAWLSILLWKVVAYRSAVLKFNK